MPVFLASFLLTIFSFRGEPYLKFSQPVDSRSRIFFLFFLTKRAEMAPMPFLLQRKSGLHMWHSLRIRTAWYEDDDDEGLLFLVSTDWTTFDSLPRTNRPKKKVCPHNGLEYHTHINRKVLEHWLTHKGYKNFIFPKVCVLSTSRKRFR